MKDLLLSPEEIKTNYYFSKTYVGWDLDMALGKVTSAQHLKTLNGILDEIDKMLLEYIRNEYIVLLKKVGEDLVKTRFADEKLTLEASPQLLVRKPFSTYLRQQLQVEPPKEEWLDKPDSEGDWWVTIRHIEGKWEKPWLIHVFPDGVEYYNEHSLPIRKFHKSFIPEPPKSKE